MKCRKASKALEGAARAICNSDEFVAHTAGVAALYRRQRNLDGADQRRQLRESLKALQRHASALSAWLEQAQAANGRHPESAALQLLGESSGESTNVHAWLSRAASSASSAIDALKANKPDTNAAVRSAAEALKATFEHHKLKWSISVTKGQVAPALNLLSAIARDAGDKSLTPAEARKALRPVAAKKR